jgi:hypothetical protein
MARKKKRKYTLKEIILYSIFIVGIITLGIFIDRIKEENKKEIINNGPEVVYGVVEKLRPRVSKNMSSRSRKDVVYMYYIKNDTVFHIIEDLPDGQIKKLEIKQYDCYAIRIAKSDKDTFNIDFSEKIDTLINKNKFEHQVYQTSIHKNIIQ